MSALGHWCGCMCDLCLGLVDDLRDPPQDDPDPEIYVPLSRAESDARADQYFGDLETMRERARDRQ